MVPKSLRSEAASLRRTGWRSVVEERSCGPTESKFSGRPWLAAGEEWPCCPNCARPMQLFVQLDLASLPAPERERLGSEGLIQLFYCTSSRPLCEVDCQAFFPFAESELARWIEAPGEEVNLEAVGPEAPFPALAIVGWEPVEDFPLGEEADYLLGVEYTEQERRHLEEIGAPVGGDKLGGWPLWVQGPEYPSCPRCDEAMELVFQIDSEDNLPYAFGDSGVGHLTRCRQHPDVLAFGWACY